LQTAENIGAVITDATDEASILELKAHVLACSAERKERVGFCGLANPEEAAALAETLNCERTVLCVPGVTYAAALAGRLLSARDPAINLNGSAVPRLAVPDVLPEAAIQTLLAAGVTVFEGVGGVTECIRALTTRTSSNGAADRSLSGINTVLIIDDVIATTRATLKARLGGGRLNGSPVESIRSQVAVLLAEKKAEGLLESFEAPRCYPAPEDPAVCVVEMSFRVAHVVSQIAVTAHIEV
jgi:phage tail sheath gpL-like